VAVVVIAWLLWRTLQPEGFGDAFISGNGRIEATEINVAAKLGGRVEDIFVREGDFVKARQPLAKMQVVTLEAQRDEARAMHQQAITSVATAKAQLAMRRSEVRSEEHTSELQSRENLVCRLLLEKKKSSNYGDI